MRHKNLTNVDGTIGKVFLDNRDRLLNESKSADDIRQTIDELFHTNNISTPKSRMIQFEMLGMTFNEAILYVQNIKYLIY